MNARSDKFMAAGLFLSAFALYVFSCSSHVAPYRDAGEMVSVLKLLGVAHPPGYPLYTLLGRFSDLFYFGSAAYQVNLFSALCAASAVTVFYWVLRTWLETAPAVLSVLFLAFSNPFWELASVSEMYTLGVLWLALLLLAHFRWKNDVLVFFLLGCGLGVRMDLLLLVPLFAVWIWKRKSRASYANITLGFILGISIYLYLPVRSGTNPWLDWGNPDSLLATFQSATRKSYSGTLDLLSLSYKKGENFWVNLELYGRHILNAFGWGVLLLAPAGAAWLYKSDRGAAVFFGFVLAVMGPFFFFLANMPPNPHSIAIVEASYLFPDVVLALFIACGIQWLFHFRPRAVMSGVVVILLGVNAAHGFNRASKRNNFYGRDYVENTLRSLPYGATAVFQKDVQLFSLWEAQLVRGKRKDVSFISKGLSGSPWYWDMKSRWPASSSPALSLKENQGWNRLKESLGEKTLVTGYDVEYAGADQLEIRPHGLVFKVSRKGEPAFPASRVLLKNLMLYRGGAAYGETPDFFSTDLIGDHARAHHQEGFYRMMNGLDEVEWFFRRSAAMDSLFPRPWSDLGYFHFQRENFEDAAEAYTEAVRRTRRLLELAADYKSLPDVVDGLKTDLSSILTHLGVVMERSRRKSDARRYYAESFQVWPNAQAHYNMAVTYWGENWDLVVRHLSTAVQLNPQMQEAQNYLARARFLAQEHGRVR